MEEHTFVTVNGLRVKIKMSYHIINENTKLHVQTVCNILVIYSLK